MTLRLSPPPGAAVAVWPAPRAEFYRVPRPRGLALLAGGRRSFAEVVHDTGLAKTTVHHHMVVLRAPGPVRVHDADNGGTSDSLRPHAVAALGARLAAFLQTGAAP